MVLEMLRIVCQFGANGGAYEFQDFVYLRLNPIEISL